MAKYSNDLPQLKGGLFLTDGGIETTLIFLEGLDLPFFAAFDLLKDEPGRERLRAYYRRHAEIGRARGQGFILESATWRASRDWGEKLGYTLKDLERVNRQAIELLEEAARAAWMREAAPVATIAPMMDPMRPVVEKSRISRADWNNEKIRPPTNDPTTPRAIVGTMPMESSPGTMARARKPAMRPTISRVRMKPSMAFSL